MLEYLSFFDCIICISKKKQKQKQKQKKKKTRVEIFFSTKESCK